MILEKCQIITSALTTYLSDVGMDFSAAAMRQNNEVKISGYSLFWVRKQKIVCYSKIIEKSKNKGRCSEFCY